MREQSLQWGATARGAYIALLCLSVLVGWHYPEKLGAYILFLLFLGFGLRPLLEWTGLHELFSLCLVRIEDRRWKKFEQRRRREVEQRERDRQYRHRHVRDARLPRRW